MSGGEIDEVNRRLASSMVLFINAATGIAEALLAARAAQLRAAAERSREQARRAREQVAVARKADAVVWRAASRPSWWKRADAADIARAWQAASAWHEVDPEAAQIRHQIERRLREEHGITITPGKESPGDARWLHTALELGISEAAVGDRTVVELAFAHTDADRDRMAGLVHSSWETGAADSVLGNEAWPAMAYRMHEIEVLGGDVARTLAGVSLAGAVNPAALAEWQIENTINHMLASRLPSPDVPAVASAAISGLDQDAARQAVADYAAARLLIAQRQLDHADLDQPVHVRVDAHAQRLQRLIAELPDSTDVVATVAATEPALLTVLRDGPLGDLANQRAQLVAEETGPAASAVYDSPSHVAATGLRLDTAVLEAAQARPMAGAVSTQELLAVAYPTTAVQGVAKAAQRQSAQPGRGKVRAKAVRRDHGR